MGEVLPAEPPTAPSGTPAISVVVPTYNRLARLGTVLDALGRQRFDEQFEVVVVSDGSTDGTNEFLRDRAHPAPVRAVIQDNQGPAAARNRGVAEARGELIVFVDDDVVADPGLLRAHWEAQRGADRLVTIGPMLAPPGVSLSPWVAWEQAMLDRQYRAIAAGEWQAGARQFYTGNAAVRRQHLVEAGGFDVALRRAEDVELAYRLEQRGLEFEFCPGAAGFHFAERSLASWRATAYAYGRTDVVFGRDRGIPWMLGEIRDKFVAYPLPVRQAVLAGATRPGIGRSLSAAVGGSGRAAFAVRLPGLSRSLFSGLYAVEYFRGVVDELGSAAAFRELIRARR